MLRFILPSLLMLALACTSEAGSDTGDTDNATTSGDPTTHGEVCTPGEESCPCADAGVCLEGLACLSNRCVMLPEGSTSSSTEAQESGTTTAIDESSTSSSSEDSSTDAGESSSSTSATFPDCEVSGTYCEAGTTTMFTCVQGMWFEHLDCVEECAEDGWATGTCDPELEATCACDGFGDAACELGTQAYCTCLPELSGASCDDDAYIENVYLHCFDGSWDVVECFGTYLIDGVIDCNAALQGC